MQYLHACGKTIGTIDKIRSSSSRDSLLLSGVFVTRFENCSLAAVVTLMHGQNCMCVLTRVQKLCVHVTACANSVCVCVCTYMSVINFACMRSHKDKMPRV